MRRFGFILISLVVLCGLLLGLADPAHASSVTITATGDAAAPTAFSPADPTRRDLGISTHLSDNRRLWVFGDTFEQGAARQSAVHANTAALTEPGDPGTFHDAFDPNGHRHPIVPLNAAESSFNHGQRFRPTGPTRVYDSRDAPGTAMTAGQSRDIPFPVPSDITGPRSAVFNLTAINTTGTFTDLEVSEPTAPAAPTTSSLNLSGFETAANLVTAPLGPPANNVFAPPSIARIRNSGGSVEVIIDLVGFLTADPDDQVYTSLTPTRLFDSTDCGPHRNLAAGEQVTVRVRGTSCLSAGAVPADATAVMVNLTADGPGSPSPTHLTAWPADHAMPATSNVNLRAHDTRANMALVPISAAGDIDLYNANGSFRAIVDVLGFLRPAPAGERFVPVTASRMCDSRDPGTVCGGSWGPGETRSVALPALHIPKGATSVALNVTIVGPTAPTHLTVWGDGDKPLASNLNAPPSALRAAMVVTPLGPDATVAVFNNAGRTDVIVDVIGFLAPPATMVGQCSSGAPRMVIWPASIVVVPGAVPPATDRVAIYYIRWVVCSAWSYLAQDVGVALADYRAGQPVTDPIIASRSTLQASVDGTVPPGAHVKGGIVSDGYVHLYGCHDDSPSNVCFLRRVPVTADLTVPASYEYFSKSGSNVSWVASPLAQSPIEFDPAGPVPSTQFPAADLSVSWIPTLGGSGSFVMMYEPRWDSGNKPVIVRTADSPWGPWSEPVVKQGGGQPVVPGCEVTSLDVLCRAFHVDPDASGASQLWFSFYAQGDGVLKHSSLPIVATPAP